MSIPFVFGLTHNLMTLYDSHPRPSCSLNIFFITWTAILLIVMMAMSLHSKFRKDEVKSKDDIRYNYGFSTSYSAWEPRTLPCYSSVGTWKTLQGTIRWSMDVGWTSTWVKIINEWFAASIYMWKLIAPIVKQQPKVMNNEESAQQINNSNSPCFCFVDEILSHPYCLFLYSFPHFFYWLVLRCGLIC